MIEFVFLRTPLFSICIWSKFSSKRKAWTLRVQTVCPSPLICHRLNSLALYLLWASATYASWVHLHVVLVGHCEHHMRWGKKESQQSCTLYLSSLLVHMFHCPIWFYLKKKTHEFKDEIIKNLKMAITEH